MHVLRLGLLACLLAGAVAEESGLPSPDALAADAIGKKELTTSSGEQFTWFAAYNASQFLDAYEATGSSDPAWLAAAQKYYDHTLAKGVSDDPDGFPGTIGAGIGEDIERAETTLLGDTVVGDANIALPLLRFAQLVRTNPGMKEKFAKRADEYVALATRMCWEKWNKRGCYYEDAQGYGSYHTYPFGVAKEDRTKWMPMPDSMISDNLNKHYKMGLVILKLWQLTGKTEYRDRVYGIFARAKAMFRLLPAEDRIVWNFWMPHGPYDIDGTSPKSWVGVHSSRPGYQEFEAGAFLAVYDAGLVFDRSDMERIVKTNLWMIANGLKSADGTSKAGGIWGKLSRLDDGIRAAYEGKMDRKKGGIGLAYLRNVLLKKTGYDRQDVTDSKQIKVCPAVVQPGKRLTMTTPIPDRLELANQDRIRLLCRLDGKGSLAIELLSADGATVLGQLFSEKVEANFITIRWDGTNPTTKAKEPGSYLVRWTFDGESRTWPVQVVAGTAKPRPAGPASLAAGETLSYDFEDFEKPLDARWILHGASVAEGQAASASHALRLGRKQKAKLVFGDLDGREEALRVKITFAAFDGGAKHAKSSANGYALGVQTGDGDFFGIFQVWRGYFNGDADVNWVHTGENQWFSSHPSGIGRAPGWNRWSFDFTGGGKPVIERDGKKLDPGRLAPERYVPAGAVALMFHGPQDLGDPDLWIDDVRVELPKAK